ncbi:Asp-tRNA(Asn)/Glu-tRNA(Gln) amidotransferase subunit GatA [Candidatus Saccharibacteria bacterium]|nr:Asp-tRNA(Asn)/Glu-tRNA(Gln) amidotransferase subunit GatA [Candidatus Saccharibacteria bacterium]
MSEISKIVDRIKSGATTARAEIEAAIKRAETDDTNAILEIIHDRALQRADAVDSGKITGRLAGVPFLAKDNFLTLDSKTTAAAKILENFKAPLQATAIERLESEGAICIGKTNLDAFAHGGSTENSAFGVTKNAIDGERVAGGSSGGSAVAVARGIVPFALGSDTGGSIRQPASFNGVVGYKPTYGMISRYGVVAMASSTDVVGPIAASVADVELLCEIMAGPDGRDGTVFPDYFETNNNGQGAKKIGLVREFMDEGVDESVRERVNDFVKKLRDDGHTVTEVDLPMAKYALPIYYIVTPAEISSNLARYDGIRYGLRDSKAKTLAEVYGMSRNQGFVDENKRRIMIGSYVLSAGFFDAYYLQAEKARTLLINEFNDLFRKYDFLVTPVAPTPAFKIGENIDDPLKMYMADVMTVPASMAGLPALSLPAGTDENGLPIGVQIIGQMKDDAQLLSFAKKYEEQK